MPRGRSYRKQKQALRKVETEIAYHNLAKRRRKMLQERYERHLLLKDKKMQALMNEELQFAYQRREDKLDWKIRAYYYERWQEERALRLWKEKNRRPEDDLYDE